jgi:hypothetical protein
VDAQRLLRPQRQRQPDVASLPALMERQPLEQEQEQEQEPVLLLALETVLPLAEQLAGQPAGQWGPAQEAEPWVPRLAETVQAPKAVAALTWGVPQAAAPSKARKVVEASGQP